MNFVDADKLIEHLGEKHTGYVGDYRLRMAIEAAKVDIGPIIRREIGEALRDVANRHIANQPEPMHLTMRMIAKQLDPPSAEPVAPKPEPEPEPDTKFETLCGFLNDIIRELRRNRGDFND